MFSPASNEYKSIVLPKYKLFCLIFWLIRELIWSHIKLRYLLTIQIEVNETDHVMNQDQTLDSQ